MSNQQKPAPPEPCNQSEGVSFTPTANFSLQSAEGTNEFLPSTLAHVAWKWLSQAGFGSWERAMSVAQSFLPSGRLPRSPLPRLLFPHWSSSPQSPQGVWLQESVNSGCLSSVAQPELISFLFHLFLCGGQQAMQVESNLSDW